jgi:DNA-binding Xre family transcriptional regulator
MAKTKTKKPRSTVGRWLQKPGFKMAVAKEYKELMLSELVLALMAQDRKSVRELADELGISKTVIQHLRSGGQSDMKLSNFVKLTRAYGYDLVLEKDGQRITL